LPQAAHDDLRQKRARLLRLVFPIWEGFITPSPPGVFTLDVKQELRCWPPVRCKEMHHLADATICTLPLFRLLVEVFQLPELLLEQRADFCESGRWPDLGVEPREIPAGHHELGEEFVAADKLPYTADFAHGAILPSLGRRLAARADVACTGWVRIFMQV
jgi:hypothetical protein